jgi:hypothetical protein
MKVCGCAITQELDGVWKLGDDGGVSKSPLPELQPPEYTCEEIEAREQPPLPQSFDTP